MNAKFCMAMLAASVLLLAGLAGCNKPTPDDTAKLLQQAGQAGSFYGLREWAKTDKPAADETATRLSATVRGTLLPYLDNGTLMTSDAVREFVDSTLFNGLKPEIADAIVASAIALDAVLPAPAPGTYLTADQVNFMRQFLTGVADGCDKYTAGAKDVPVPKYKGKDLPKTSKWLTGKTKVVKKAELNTTDTSVVLGSPKNSGAIPIPFGQEELIVGRHELIGQRGAYKTIMYGEVDVLALQHKVEELERRLADK